MKNNFGKPIHTWANKTNYTNFLLEALRVQKWNNFFKVELLMFGQVGIELKYF